MNAAARFASQGAVTRSVTLTLSGLRTYFSTIFLTLVVLTSALSLVYVTNYSRSLNAALQQAATESDQLRIQWGQLLLEKSTWVVQARVQRVAEDKLGMVIPDSKSIMILSSK